jgi:Uma2 family endonuclease
MSSSALDYNLYEDQHYTYADMLEWDESLRAEIIDGEVYMMSPPARFHQDISSELHGQLWTFLKGKPCKLYPAPFGVRLFPKEDLSDDTVVEPDIVVVCDHSKLDDRGCNGAPDLVVEILSPSNTQRDRIVKFRKYLAAGVREYWVVDPHQKTVEVHILQAGQYVTTVYDASDEAPVSVLPGCKIKLRDVFPGEEPQPAVPANDSRP